MRYSFHVLTQKAFDRYYIDALRRHLGDSAKIGVPLVFNDGQSTDSLPTILEQPDTNVLKCCKWLTYDEQTGITVVLFGPEIGDPDKIDNLVISMDEGRQKIGFIIGEYEGASCLRGVVVSRSLVALPEAPIWSFMDDLIGCNLPSHFESHGHDLVRGASIFVGALPSFNQLRMPYPEVSAFKLITSLLGMYKGSPVTA